MADWTRIEEIFLAAADLAGADRTRYLDDACADDAALRREVESLLNADGKAEPALGGAVATAARAFSVGDPTNAGPYKLVREIGRGGMGAVYLGERADGELTKQVAVKLVQKGWDQTVVAGRFLRERQILAGLEHSNIARLLDGGRLADGTPYMVMEYVDGLPLDQYAQGRTVNEKLQLFRKICDAVDYAHRKLVVHRDIKPGNILVTSSGEPKLLDFGISKMLGENAAKTAITRTGALMLTPDYASPEQIRGKEITTATDVYQLGAVLYELLTGSCPHNIDTLTPAEIEHVICEVEPAAPGFGDELDNIVFMALKKEPARRYPSAREFAADIDNYLAHRPVAARPDTLLYRANKFVRRHRIGVAAAALVAVSIVTGVVMTVRAQRRAEQRFQQVRKLANTFLFDLDAQIRDITGTTQARELLVKTALEYLDSLSADAQGDPSLEDEIATAYMRVGDVLGGAGIANLGKRNESTSAYAKAVTIRERRAAGKSVASRERLDLAYAHGRILGVQMDEALMETSLRDARAFVVAHPEVEVGYETLVDLLSKHSMRRFRRSLNGPAIAEAREIIALATARREKFPGEAADLALADGYTVLANPLSFTGQLEETRELLLRSIELRERLSAKSPDNATWKRTLSRDHSILARTLWVRDGFHLEKPDESLAHLLRSYSIVDELFAKDPSNVVAELDVLDITDALARLLAEHDPPAALKYANRAVGIAEATVARLPNSASAKHNLADVMSTAAATVYRGNHAAAISAMERGLALRWQIANASPQQPGLRYLIVNDYRRYAAQLIAVGRRTDAARAYAEGEKIAAAIDPDKTSLGYVVASAHLYHDLAALNNSCASIAKEAAAWRSLAERKVAPSFITPRLAAAEKRTAACKR
ncbi:MAG: serine/threonine protein kinase [Acidobacteria bacterium]|nr:serine/threonine protein kinase [Acidobacteriota bacterium]